MNEDLSVTEAARVINDYLGHAIGKVNRARLDNWRTRGTGPPWKKGIHGRVYYGSKELMEWILARAKKAGVLEGRTTEGRPPEGLQEYVPVEETGLPVEEVIQAGRFFQVLEPGSLRQADGRFFIRRDVLEEYKAGRDYGAI